MFKRLKSTSSTRWLERQMTDQYARQSKQMNYKSRAAFKLMEINDKFRIFNKRNKRILDLGFAPGSWSQVAYQQCSKYHAAQDIRILGVDILPYGPMKGAAFMQGDLRASDIQQRIVEHFSDGTDGLVDVIMSDMMTNTMGNKEVDHLASCDLCYAVLDLTGRLLRKNGTLVMKFFSGKEEPVLVSRMESMFKKVYRFKPQSSRDQAREIYLIGNRLAGESPKSQVHAETCP